MSDYSKMTSEDFTRILETIVEEEGSNILSIGSVHSELAEHFNNEVLSRWEEEQAYKPFCSNCEFGEEIEGSEKILCTVLKDFPTEESSNTVCSSHPEIKRRSASGKEKENS